MHGITEAYNKSIPFAVDITDRLKSDDIVIAVMGPTGSGKSTFVSIMTNYDLKIGDSLKSCTSSIASIRVPSHRRQDYGDLVFVDTPGFDDTQVSDVDILKMIYDWLRDSDVKLSGLLYFHRISDKRMAAAPLRNLRMVEKLCGKDMLHSVTLVTTMWDEVDEKVGRRREQELVENYWKNLVLLGSQTKRFIRNQDRGSSRFAILEPLISEAAERHQKRLSVRGHEWERRRIFKFLSRYVPSIRPSNQTVLVQKQAPSGYQLPVQPPLNFAELVMAYMTMYSELKTACVDSQYDQVFKRLQQEWTFIGGLLVALAAVDTAVFSMSLDGLFSVDSYAPIAIATSSIASGLGIGCDAWFLLRYNWADLNTFKYRARDLYGSYFFFSLSSRVPALCMFISALSLMGFLGLVAFAVWPQGVLVVCFIVGVIMSLQFWVYGAHWCATKVVDGGRAGTMEIGKVAKMTMGRL